MVISELNRVVWVWQHSAVSVFGILVSGNPQDLFLVRVALLLILCHVLLYLSFAFLVKQSWATQFSFFVCLGDLQFEHHISSLLAFPGAQVQLLMQQLLHLVLERRSVH